MSVALTDVLIELSDPNRLFEFKKDPDAYLRGRGLTSEERSMLANGDKKGIRLFAKSVNSGDKTQQFNRYESDALLANIDPVVHLDCKLTTTSPQLELALCSSEMTVLFCALTAQANSVRNRDIRFMCRRLFYSDWGVDEEGIACNCPDRD